jgi:hypothetical protein
MDERTGSFGERKLMRNEATAAKLERAELSFSVGKTSHSNDELTLQNKIHDFLLTP